MPPLGLLVFVVGAGSLGAEIAGVRLLAPYFGASTIVWANTISVVLVALSLGYWLGGRLADRHPTRRALCLVSLGAAVLLAGVPFAGRPLLRAGTAALDQVSVGAFLGSLAAVSVLLSVPILLMGAVSPWALRLAVRGVDDAGTVAGRLYAISTAGSLAGTLLSALVLIPAIGTRDTFIVLALTMSLIAVMGLRPWRFFAAVPLAIAALFAAPGTSIEVANRDGRVIYETDTAYQFASVLQRPDGTRLLELNEGQAVHSELRPGSYLTGNYWDDMLVLPSVALGRAPRSVAILGNGGGTTARALGHYFGGTRVDAVEIDRKLTEIGRRYFDLRGPHLRVHHADARVFLRSTHARYDAILLDVYRQPYIPFYMVTREFFQLARERLMPGGALIVNVGHPEGDHRLERVLAGTLRSALPYVMSDPVTPTNSEFVATAKPFSPSVAGIPPGLTKVATAASSRLASAPHGGVVYTDDRAPVEWLIDRSIVRYAERSPAP
jgi:spermidine synthase